MTLEQILDALSERLRPEHTIFATPYRPTVWRNLTPDIRYALAHGDHWLGGALWRGRRPQDGDMREIETLFTQDDRIAPALELYVSATLGNGWDWNERTDEGQELTPLEQGETEALSVWHYDAGLDTALSRLLYLATAMRSSYLRLYVPDDYDTEPIRTLEDAFDVMHAQVLDSRQAGKILDDHGRVAAMYYRYSVRENNQDVPHIELHTPETIHYYRAESRLEPLKNDDGSLKIIPNPLYDPRRKRKPRYLIQELDIGAALLTEGIADLQCRLNVSRVNEARNDDLHGFPALYTLDTENPVDDDGRETKWQLEPDVVMQIKSDPKELDADGNTLERYQGKVGRLEAVDPDYILKTISSYHESIAEAFHLTWLYDSALSVSGESKRESRAAFNKRISALASKLEDACTLLLENATLYARHIVSGANPEPLSYSFAPSFDIDLPAADVSNFLALLPAYDKGLISLEGVLEFSPVADKDAERQRLEQGNVAREDGDPSAAS